MIVQAILQSLPTSKTENSLEFYHHSGSWFYFRNSEREVAFDFLNDDVDLKKGGIYNLVLDSSGCLYVYNAVDGISSEIELSPSGHRVVINYDI